MAVNRSWIKLLAKAGYASRGLIYLIIAVFAFLAAFGGTATKDSEGALIELVRRPFGKTLLWTLIAGLCGYVLWRIFQALFDTDDHGLSVKGLGVRAGLLASAMTYSLLALFALSLLGFGNTSDSSSSSIDILSALVGQNWINAGFGVAFAIVGFAHIWKAVRQKYERHFQASQKAMNIIHPISMIGLSARGIVFFILAGFGFYRVFNAEMLDAKPGLKDALVFLQTLPFGRWLLAAVAVGLFLFSAYSFIEARWRRINIEDA